MIKSFASIGKSDLNLVGGKAMSLGRMTQEGFPIPPGFVLTTNAFNQDRSLWESSILENFDRLGCQFVAVRSSGTKEDGIDDSFAGQFDTYLYVDRDHLIQKIIECHDSIFSERLQNYCDSKDIDITSIKVAVVIQKMINSEAAGVGFSVHPVTQDKNSIIIEGALGLGEAVVSGSITPDSYIIDKYPTEVIDKFVSRQTKKLIGKKEGGIMWVNVVTQEQNMQKITDQKITELSKLIIKIEQFYKFPVDIERAIEDDKIYITQSRPITTLEKTTEGDMTKMLPASIYNSLQNNIEWYHKSYAGYMRGIHHQGMSIAYASVSHEDAIPYGINFVNVHNKKHRDRCRDNTLLTQKRNKILSQVTSNPNYISDLYEEYDIKNKLYFNLREQIRKLDYTQKQFPEIKRNLKELYDVYVSHAGIGYIVDTFLTNEKVDWLENRIRKELGSATTTDIIETLTAPTYRSFVNDSENEKLFIIKAIQQGESKKGIITLCESYIDKYIRLGTNYNDFKAITVVDILQECENQAVLIKDIDKRIREMENYISHNKKEKEKIYESLGISSDLQAIIHASEVFTHIQDRRKQTVLRTNFVFLNFLTWLSTKFKQRQEYALTLLPEELRDILDGREVDWLAVEKRYNDGMMFIYYNNQYKMYTGEEIKEIVSLERFYPDISHLTILSGTTAYKGRVTGLVRILKNSSDIAQFKEGEILVTNQTTPEFVPAMKKALAVVTDQGGITCHAAIIARELKKPSIIGTKHATQALQTGDRIELNADNGTITILHRKQKDIITEKRISQKYHYIHKRFRTPFYTFLLRDSMRTYHNKDFPFDYACDIVYLNEEIAITLDTRETQEKKIMDMFQDSPASINHFYDYSYDIQSQIEEYYQSYVSRYKELTKSDLIVFWRTYLSLMQKMLSPTLIPLFIEGWMEEQIKEKVMSKYNKEEAELYYHNATTAIKVGTAFQEQVSLLDIAIAQQDGKDIDFLIEEHLKQFAWTKNNSHDGSFKKYDDVIIQISNISSPIIRKQELLNHFKEVKRGITKLYEDFHHDQLFKHILDTLQESIYFRSRRTERCYKNAYYIDPVFQVSAKILGLHDYKDIFYLTLEEIINVLEKDSTLPDIANRKKCYMTLADYTSIVTLSGDAAEQAIQQIHILPIKDNKTITGQVAFKGSVKGKAVIVTHKDQLDKIEEGDILVTTATTVNYIPYLKKVKAIVANEGGVLSHASVISRELQIPTIIGTINATELLNDGDIIEVNANQGIVYKVNNLEGEEI